jgi:3-phosphoshikimate 1-carboxyvinyltransferase
VSGGQRLTARNLDVPGDISSAAFWMVAAAALPESEIVIESVGVNPTRTGIIDVLRRLGADVQISGNGSNVGEPIGTIRVRHGHLGTTVIEPAEVPGVIDELPVLAPWPRTAGSCG